MAFMLNSLKIGTYNCQSFNDYKAIYIKQALDECYFLFIQEHCKYMEQLKELHSLGNINYHGCSSMDITQQLIGRPHGGCVIMWSDNFTHRIEVVNTISNRLCALVVSLHDNKSLLLINCYMPCDDRVRGPKYNALLETINELENIILSSNADYIVIGGDWNGDLNRNTPHVQAIRDFSHATNMHFGTNHILAKIDYTFESKSCGSRSIIDHLLFDKSLFGIIKTYEVFHSIDNFSDHSAVICELDLNKCLN